MKLNLNNNELVAILTAIQRDFDYHTILHPIEPIAKPEIIKAFINEDIILAKVGV